MSASKLRLQENQDLTLLGDARGFALPLPTGARIKTTGKASAVIAFVATAKELARVFPKAASAVAPDGLFWVSYPKAKQLGTDLNRDTLARAVQAEGWEPVAMVSLDDVWSSIRLKQDAKLTASRTARGASIGGKKNAAKKTAAKKTTTTKSPAKKTATKKTTTKSSAKPAAKKTTTRKSAAAPAAKKSAARKAPAKTR